MGSRVLPVLMAGGSGTRLWPLSREMYPKQLLRLTGRHSLLQNTALRAAAVRGALPPLVICGEAHRFLVGEQLREAGIRDATIILEPEGRNTAPTATVAALHARDRYGGDTQILLLAADHLIANTREFARAVQAASAAAGTDRLLTFGVVPTEPATGYGYLQSGRALPGKERVLKVAAFIEKPSLRRAKTFYRSRRYFWNSGMFLFAADRFLDEVQRLERGMLRACVNALAEAQRDADFVRLDAGAFRKARKESIDYAIMEKATDIALVPLDAGWDDIGSWSFLQNQKPTDRHGNCARGDVLLHDTKDTMIHATSRLVAAVGVENHIIVETGDAVLVTTPEHAQDVKKIVEALKKAKRPEAQNHSKVFRPWGWYDSIGQGDGFQVKRIGVNPGQKLSLQLHHKRAEHWVVVKGTARITIDDRVFELQENQSTFIPLGAKHRLENTTTRPVEIIEVQCGSYLGEDDIVRFDDVYGRSGTTG